MNRLYFGDNLDILSDKVKDESVDLVYLDPPFNSKAEYSVIFKSENGEPSGAQAKAFQDSWRWGEASQDAIEKIVAYGGKPASYIGAFMGAMGQSSTMAYLAMMTVRLIQLRRVMKPTASLYLHCDPSASHYLKVILDSLFGEENFRSEVVWRRSSAHNKLSKQYGPIHDNILFYSRSKVFHFEPGCTPYTRQYVSKQFRRADHDGRHYRLNELTGPGTRQGASGSLWGEYDPTNKGRHWAIPASLRQNLPNNGAGMSPQSMLDHLNELGWIHFSADGRPTYRQYPGRGVPYQDIWAFQPGTEGCVEGTNAGIDADVKWLDHDNEREGYPTQKPVGLLSRIIATSSRPGDMVLDPFCGCGTTVHAAQALGRSWTGIDITHHAVSLIQSRIKRNFDGLHVEVEGRPADLEGARNLAKRDKYQFQWWANYLFGVQQYREKKGADGGIDGEIFFLNGPHGIGKIIVSAKGGADVGPTPVRELGFVVDREKAQMGVLVMLEEPTQSMKNDALSAGNVQTAHGRFPKLQIVSIANLFDGKRPLLPHRAPFERLRTVALQEKRHRVADPQFGFLFHFEGGRRVEPTGDVVYVDPEMAFAEEAA
ncbi:MAG TPA: DNA methyltransferase [Allosphingosinicella sp.]|jgi:site-specific DNA-methyltransferase (adenine-specific)|nr:DNA methyltransferase [Allosphingosinicella sp.]